MNEQFQLFFVQRFKGKVLFNVPMKDYTSLRIGGPADVMAFPEDEADLKELVKFAYSKRFPLVIVGGGTNLLVRDGGVRGIVVNVSDGLRDIEWLGGGKVSAGAGVQLATLLRESAKKGLSGLEFAAGIPGLLGGAVAMNAGAYGGEMRDVVEGVEIIDRKGKKRLLTASELKFGYRVSEVPEGAVITRVRFELKEGDPARIEERIAEIREKRRAKEPIKGANAGCIFKNPEEGDLAGKLIDDAGLKGARSGGAEISRVHANYIVNTDGATAHDVLSLMALVRDKVYGGSGVTLEPEIKVVGED